MSLARFTHGMASVEYINIFIIHGFSRRIFVRKIKLAEGSKEKEGKTSYKKRHAESKVNMSRRRSYFSASPAAPTSKHMFSKHVADKNLNLYSIQNNKHGIRP